MEALRRQKQQQQQQQEQASKSKQGQGQGQGQGKGTNRSAHTDAALAALHTRLPMLVLTDRLARIPSSRKSFLSLLER